MNFCYSIFCYSTSQKSIEDDAAYWSQSGDWPNVISILAHRSAMVVVLYGGTGHTACNKDDDLSVML